MYGTYKKLNEYEIGIKLRLQNIQTYFTEYSSIETKFDELETAAIAIDINFDIDLVNEALENELNLTDCLEAAQVEFCCG